MNSNDESTLRHALTRFEDLTSDEGGQWPTVWAELSVRYLPSPVKAGAVRVDVGVTITQVSRYREIRIRRIFLAYGPSLSKALKLARDAVYPALRQYRSGDFRTMNSEVIVGRQD